MSDPIEELNEIRQELRVLLAREQELVKAMRDAIGPSLTGAWKPPPGHRRKRSPHSVGGRILALLAGGEKMDVSTIFSAIKNAGTQVELSRLVKEGYVAKFANGMYGIASTDEFEPR